MMRGTVNVWGLLWHSVGDNACALSRRTRRG